MQQYPQDEKQAVNWQQTQFQPKSQTLQNTQASYLPNTQQPYPPNTQQPYPPNTSQLPPAQNSQQSYTPNTQSPYPQNGQGYRYNFSEKQMRRYFSKPSKTFIWLAAIGAILLFFGILIGSGVPLLGTPFIILGLVFFAAGGIPLFIHYTQRPNDEQYASWVAERAQPLYYTAIQRLHVDVEGQRPTIVEVEGGISSLVQLTKKFPEKEIIVKRLSNGLRHYSINTAMHIFLTKNEIAIYSGYVNALAQKERFEDAVRYYYQDIVAVSTSGPIFLYQNGTEIQKQGFLVSANNGDVIGTDYANKVILRDGEKKVMLEGVDRVVPALLHFLKDHKVSSIEANTTASGLL